MENKNSYSNLKLLLISLFVFGLGLSLGSGINNLHLFADIQSIPAGTPEPTEAPPASNPAATFQSLLIGTDNDRKAGIDADGNIVSKGSIQATRDILTEMGNINANNGTVSAKYVKSTTQISTVGLNYQDGSNYYSVYGMIKDGSDYIAGIYGLMKSGTDIKSFGHIGTKVNGSYTGVYGSGETGIYGLGNVGLVAKGTTTGAKIINGITIYNTAENASINIDGDQVSRSVGDIRLGSNINANNRNITGGNEIHAKTFKILNGGSGVTGLFEKLKVFQQDETNKTVSIKTCESGQLVGCYGGGNKALLSIIPDYTTESCTVTINANGNVSAIAVCY